MVSILNSPVGTETMETGFGGTILLWV